MKPVLRALALATLFVLVLPGHGSAHFGGEAFILVPGDHVLPGQPFEVIVADLTPGSTVELTVTRNELPVSVGTAISDTEGHFTTSANLPADFPNGYVELIATAQDGTRVSTFVLVGPRTPETGGPPAVAASGGLDPSLVVLGVLVGASVGAAGYVLLRRKGPAPEPAPVVGRRVPSKRSRRRSGPS